MDKTGVNSKIWAVVEARRVAKGIKIGKLADKLNISRKRMERIRTGKMTLVELEDILKALDLSMLIIPSAHLNSI